LTALLQSKTVDFPTGNEEKKSEAIASKAMVSQGKKELLTTPVNNGFDGRFNSTPIVSSSVGEFNMLYLTFFCSRVHTCICVLYAHPHMHIVPWLCTVALFSNSVASHHGSCFT
jgi:hypothetical protein